MEILFLSSQIPFRETRAGGAKRLFYLAKELEKHGNLHLAALDVCSEIDSASRRPSEFGRALILPFDFTKPRSISRFHCPIDFRADFGHLWEPLEAFIGDARFDLTIVAFPPALSLLLRLPRNRLGRVAYLEDDLIQEVYRKAALQGGAMTRMLRRLRHRQVLKFLASAAARVDFFIGISEEEQKISRLSFTRSIPLLYRYGLPVRELPCLPPPEDRRVLGFIGNFLHRPNLDAMDWMLENLLPALRERQPGFRLLIAGTRMPLRVLESLREFPNVEYVDDVSDLKDFYGRIGIFLNPIFTGRGVRTKVVEAAAYGRPVVSTPLGAEGLGEFRIPLAEHPDDFLDTASALVADPQRYDDTVRHNRRRFEQDFSVEAQVGHLMAEIASERPG